LLKRWREAAWVKQDVTLILPSIPSGRRRKWPRIRRSHRR